MELSTHVEEKLKENKFKYKLLVLVLKFTPMLAALFYMSSTIFNYFGYSIEPLSNIGGMSLLAWLFIYLASIVFKFCAYHRMFLWYVFIDDSFNIIDYYWKIPISTDKLLMAHNFLIGITLFIVLILYVRDHKKSTSESNKRY